jgi:lipopolysaccharide transport system ATP-binding protein
VRNYSSGMKVRLGFAVASNLDPDVLLIDEVLAVGDTGFRLKCYNKLDKLMENAAVIFVSHSMPQIMRMSSSILLMDKGKIQYLGNDLSKGVDLYFTKFSFDIDRTFSNDHSELKRFEILADKVDECFQINYLSEFNCEIDIWIDPIYENPIFTLVFFDKELKGAACIVESVSNTKDGFLSVRLEIPKISLSKGKFSLTLNVNGSSNSSPIFKKQGIAELQILGGDIRWTPVLFESSHEKI